MIILINGPPGSGKDTAAEIIKVMIGNCKHIKMSTPLKKGIREIYALTHKQVLWVEEFSDDRTKLFNGISYRDEQIALFQHLAQLHGDTILAELLYKDLRIQTYEIWKHVVVSDCGRKVEAQYIKDRYPGQVGIIQLKKDGCSFDNDIREYISDDDANWIDNKYDEMLFKAQLAKVMRKWKLIDG